ncbi:MAG TPA: hypothetical protein VNM24_06135 [Burkholderiales bacterium]|jgi:hypothetical protein|nr:hypothetical protein [Burkholderiales bacterium]
MCRWKLAVVLLISLWLPVQGMAAVVMPFCKHGLVGEPDQGIAPPASTAHAGLHATNGHAAGHADHAAHAAQAGANHTAQASLIPCDDCGHCHLSCAFTLPSPGLTGAGFVSVAAPASAPGILHGTVPLPEHRPPLFTLI